jgi:membrane protease YdiL (CAAX protease family)
LDAVESEPDAGRSQDGPGAGLLVILGGTDTGLLPYIQNKCQALPQMSIQVPQLSEPGRSTGTLSAIPDDPFTAALRGFGPLGILAILLILFGNVVFIPFSAVLVLVWARWSRTPLSKLGFVRPGNWFVSLAIGIAFGIAFKFLMKVLVMPLLGADPVNHAYHYLEGNRAAIPGTLYALIVGAGFGEETLFRGYMFERLGKLLGAGIGAKIVIVLITSTLFGFAHYSVQGLAGVEQATIVGLVLGGIFALTGRIWLLMFAHAAFDLTAYAIIYCGLETRVAHLIFK